MSRDLNDLNPYVAYLANKLISECSKQGINIFVTQTLRTIAEQDALYAQGRTAPGSIVTNARGGYSIHNFGYAFDVAIRNADGSVNWNDADYYPIGQIGKDIGLEWGGDFTSIVDTPHFQYTQGLSTSQFRAGERPVCPEIPTEQEATKIEERNGFSMFNEAYYLQTYPDIAAAVAKGSINAKDHYYNYGKAEGRRGYPELPKDFNEGAYLKYNEDIAQVVKAGDYTCGAEHWLLFGWKDGRRYTADVVQASPVVKDNSKELKNKIINYINSL